MLPSLPGRQEPPPPPPQLSICLDHGTAGLGAGPCLGTPSRLRRRFYITCIAAFDDMLIAKLAQKGFCRGPRSQRRSPCTTTRCQEHVLIVEAKSGEEAVERARGAVLAADGEAPDLTLVGSKAD